MATNFDFYKSAVPAINGSEAVASALESARIQTAAGESFAKAMNIKRDREFQERENAQSRLFTAQQNYSAQQSRAREKFEDNQADYNKELARQAGWNANIKEQQAGETERKRMDIEANAKKENAALETEKHKQAEQEKRGKIRRALFTSQIDPETKDLYTRAKYSERDVLYGHLSDRYILSRLKNAGMDDEDAADYLKRLKQPQDRIVLEPDARTGIFRAITGHWTGAADQDELDALAADETDKYLKDIPDVDKLRDELMKDHQREYNLIVPDAEALYKQQAKSEAPGYKQVAVPGLPTLKLPTNLTPEGASQYAGMAADELTKKDKQGMPTFSRDTPEAAKELAAKRDQHYKDISAAMQENGFAVAPPKSPTTTTTAPVKGFDALPAQNQKRVRDEIQRTKLDLVGNHNDLEKYVQQERARIRAITDPAKRNEAFAAFAQTVSDSLRAQGLDPDEIVK